LIVAMHHRDTENTEKGDDKGQCRAGFPACQLWLGAVLSSDGAFWAVTMTGD